MNLNDTRRKIKTRRICCLMMLGVFALMLFVIKMIVMTKAQSSQYKISDSQFFAVENDTEAFRFSGLKISSRDDLENCYQENYPADMLAYLKGLTNLSFMASFIYITRDSTLKKIDSVSSMRVKAARLETAPHAGFGVYVISGDPNSAIKATD